MINHSTPVLIHGFHSASGFLQCLWNCTSSLEELFLIRSPRNSTDFDTHYIFLSHNDDAFSDAFWMINRILDTGNKVYKSGRYAKFKSSENKAISINHGNFFKLVWIHFRSVFDSLELRNFSFFRITQETLKSVLSTVHFGIQPLHEVGNWIPEVLKQWTCQDHNCGFDQVIIQSDKGK